MVSLTSVGIKEATQCDGWLLYIRSYLTLMDFYYHGAHQPCTPKDILEKEIESAFLMKQQFQGECVGLNTREITLFWLQYSTYTKSYFSVLWVYADVTWTAHDIYVMN